MAIGRRSEERLLPRGGVGFPRFLGDRLDGLDGNQASDGADGIERGRDVVVGYGEAEALAGREDVALEDLRAWRLDEAGDSDVLGRWRWEG
jgi:hypothetical protein